MKVLLIASAARMSLAALFPPAALKDRGSANDIEDDPLLPFPGIWDRAQGPVRSAREELDLRGEFLNPRV